MRKVKPEKKSNAFTLIELLVSIAIIGILATISTVVYNNYISEARIAKGLSQLSSQISKLHLFRLEYQQGNVTAEEMMAEDLAVVAEAIYLGRMKQNATLYAITGESCSDCDCRDENFIAPLSVAAQTCVDRWNAIMVILKDASDIDVSFLDTDPWGSPYLVDENEEEYPAEYCRKDTLFSAGPDRVHQHAGGGVEEAAGDGYSIRLDFYDTAQCGT